MAIREKPFGNYFRTLDIIIILIPNKMKKTLIILLLFCSAFMLKAQDTISDNIYQKNGRLGIGSSDPFTWLSVENNHPELAFQKNVSLMDLNRVYQGSSARFHIYGYPDSDVIPEFFRGSIMLYATGDAKNFKISSGSPGGVITFMTNGWINEEDEKMRIAASGNVGIGTLDPLHKLDVAGDINFTGSILQNGSPLSFTGPWSADDPSLTYFDGKVGIGIISPDYSLDVLGDINFSGDLLRDGNPVSGNTPWLETSTDTIHYSGIVGIGTSAPSSKLEVANGDIYISDIDNGIIMKSPDGTCWRGVLDNSGNLHFSPISCPESRSTQTQSLLKSNFISVYPNPTESAVTVSISSLNIPNVSYALLNTNGSILEQGSLASDMHQFDLSQFSNGIYFLRIYDKEGNKIALEKIIKE